MATSGGRGGLIPNRNMEPGILEMDQKDVSLQADNKSELPSIRTVMCRTLLETTFFIGLMMPMGYIYVIMKGKVSSYRRGFFCDDENLKHPMLEEKISVGQCVGIWAAIGLLIIAMTEVLHYRVHVFPSWWQDMFKRPTRSALTRLPVEIIQIYRIVGYFAFGAVATLLTTEIAKYQVGRLRPHFLTVCDIDLSDDLCKDNGFYKFVTDYNCTGTKDGMESHDVMEARKSFLSGHSSFSFYSATFLILYLQARLYSRRPLLGVERIQRGVSKVLFRAGRTARPFIQFCIFALAFWICMTRISDYKHHPGDVAVGMLVGVVWAVLVHGYTLELFARPLSFWDTRKNNQQGD